MDKKEPNTLEELALKIDKEIRANMSEEEYSKLKKESEIIRKKWEEFKNFDKNNYVEGRRDWRVLSVWNKPKDEIKSIVKEMREELSAREQGHHSHHTRRYWLKHNYDLVRDINAYETFLFRLDMEEKYLIEEVKLWEEKAKLQKQIDEVHMKIREFNITHYNSSYVSYQNLNKLLREDEQE